MGLCNLATHAEEIVHLKHCQTVPFEADRLDCHYLLMNVSRYSDSDHRVEQHSHFHLLKQYLLD